MSKGKAALDALKFLTSGIKKVDLGDMARPVTGARLDALESMLPKAAKAGDDWGWKGGKPGEITGEMYERALTNKDFATVRKAEDQMITAWKKKNPVGMVMADELDRYYANPFYSTEKARAYSTADLMNRFAKLEKADFPREWTGKAFSSFSQSQFDSPYVLNTVSDLMRPLTNDQRETFLALLPEWSGSLDDLAAAARSL